MKYTTEEIIDLLYKCNSREDGYNLLSINNNDELRLIVIKLDIPMPLTKNLANRIIERTIGFRLRSNAIRGTSKNI